MRQIIASLALFLGSALPAAAADVAQGHHLWSVIAPSGIRSYVAAVSTSAHPDNLALVKKQLHAGASVRRTAEFGQSHAINFASNEWKSKAQHELSPELLSAIEAELGPALKSVYKVPPQTVRFMKLDAVRLLLSSDLSDVYARGHSPVQQELTKFQRERSGNLILRPQTEGEIVHMIEQARLADKRTPAEIISLVLNDRLEHGAVGTRSRNLFLKGNWKELRALEPKLFIASLGVQLENLDRILSISDETPADQAFSALSDIPTLLMVQGSHLGEDPNLLTLLERRGFEVRPVSLNAIPGEHTVPDAPRERRG